MTRELSVDPGSIINKGLFSIQPYESVENARSGTRQRNDGRETQASQKDFHGCLKLAPSNIALVKSGQVAPLTLATRVNPRRKAALLLPTVTYKENRAHVIP